MTITTTRSLKNTKTKLRKAHSRRKSADAAKHTRELPLAMPKATVNYCVVSRRHTDAQIKEVRSHIESVLSS